MSKARTLELSGLRSRASWLDEPLLVFQGGRFQADPRVGIPLYGPRSFGTTRHRDEVHVGVIGMGEEIDRAVRWLQGMAGGVDGDDDHAPFPGFLPAAGFRSRLRFASAIQAKLTHSEMAEAQKPRLKKDRFTMVVDLLRAKVAWLAGRDHPLDYVLVVLPDSLVEECRSVDFVEGGVVIHRDLRAAFKAAVMDLGVSTQILQESTLPASGKKPTNRDLDHAAVVAWNLFTGLYFKVDGLPWGPAALAPGSCFIGISFFRPLGEGQNVLRTSVVQAFDENGDGLVLRGHRFPWNEQKEGRSPHLKQEQAYSLVEMVLDRYKQERGVAPSRVVVHKSSRYEAAETDGFRDALGKVPSWDLVAVRPTSDNRLIRAGQYPPLRGTVFNVGDLSYMYTVGYIPELGRYPHGHVPSALQIADHIGDTAKRELFTEILLLTKMNWNSANMYGQMPITLRFARKVAEILRERGEDDKTQAKYKFYM